MLEACKAGTLQDVRAALSRGATANCMDDNLSTCLMWACERRDDWVLAEAVVQMLLSRGADVLSRNKQMRAAIHYAAQFSSSGVVALLLEAKSPVDLCDDVNAPPLVYCCRRDDTGDSVTIASSFLGGRWGKVQANSTLDCISRGRR